MSTNADHWHENAVWRSDVTERQVLAGELEMLADSADIWGVTPSSNSSVVQRLRELAELIRDPDDVTTERWTEVRVTGQPPHGYPAYDFTFRSDAKSWEDRHKIGTRALAEWNDGRVQSRQVQREVRVTEWQDIEPAVESPS